MYKFRYTTKQLFNLVACVAITTALAIAGGSCYEHHKRETRDREISKNKGIAMSWTDSDAAPPISTRDKFSPPYKLELVGHVERKRPVDLAMLIDLVPNTVEVTVENCIIQDQPLLKISSGARHLQLVRLINCDVSDEAVASLMKKRPDLVIERE